LTPHGTKSQRGGRRQKIREGMNGRKEAKEENGREGYL
jgi:hypothetical protein